MPGEGKRFSSDYQPEEKGRRPNQLEQAREQLKFSASDHRQMLINLTQDKTRDDIMNIIKDPKTDIKTLIYAKALLADLASGSLTNLTKIIEWMIGKPKEQIDINANIKTDSLIQISFKE